MAFVSFVARVHKVTVNVMFEYEFGRVKPIVEDLAAHDVPSDAPAVLVPLVAQPIVSY